MVGWKIERAKLDQQFWPEICSNTIVLTAQLCFLCLHRNLHVRFSILLVWFVVSTILRKVYESLDVFTNILRLCRILPHSFWLDLGITPIFNWKLSIFRFDTCWYVLENPGSLTKKYLALHIIYVECFICVSFGYNICDIDYAFFACILLVEHLN